MTGGQSFLIGIVLISTIGWVITSWIRARHGYAATDGCGKTVAGSEPAAEWRIATLSSENAGLKNQVGRLEERLAVLERIATDPAERTAREIESLR